MTSSSLFVPRPSSLCELTEADLLPSDPRVLQVEPLVRQALAELGLGFLMDTSPDAPPPPTLAPSGPSAPEEGLATALLLLARVLGLSARPGLLAWGALDARGGLQPVSERSLTHTARLLVGVPSVQAVLLCRERASLQQPSCAEQMAAMAPPGVRVLGVKNLAEACEETLGLTACARDARIALPSTRRGAVVERIFRLALEGVPPVLGWRLVAALCSGLLMKHLDDSMLRRKASFARDIARRHDGEGVLIPWPEEDFLDAFPRDTRLGIAAHLVQSASDAAPWLGDDRDELAWPMVATGALLPADARLLGALGRSEAARGLYAQAASTLERAVNAWLSLGLLEESSYPLCERLRVAGLLGAKEDVLRLCKGPADTFLEDPRSSPIGKTFVRLAASRALIQAGEPEQALPALQPQALWGAAPDHVATSRLRWLAAAQRATGLANEARSTLEALAALGETDQLHLARLDEALALGGDWNPHAADLMAMPGVEVENLIERLSSKGPKKIMANADFWKSVVAEYRY